MTTKIALTNIADTALATLTGPKITTIVYPGDDTATDIAGGQTINLTGAGFQSGCSVLVASTASSVVSFINSTQISFVAPALTAGTYVIYVINPDGGTAISIPGISYSGTPNWTTAAGTLGTAYETGSISATLAATGDAPVTYALATGTLPPGSTLNSNGTLSGTAQATASATTYSFTIKASDAQNQDTSRAFSITINPDVVTFSTPADSTTYNVFKDAAITNVAMSATSAAGGSITYTADTLPTGLSIGGANIVGTPTVVASTTTVLTATATSTRSATRTINWVVSIANDIYWKNTTLLLNGATSVTPFINDASLNNMQLTIAGDTKPNKFSPYYGDGYYSNYFDGTGDYVTTPSNTAFAFGTGDFTMECWIYPISTVTAMRLFEMVGGDNIDLNVTSTGTISYYNGSTSTTSAAGLVNINNWYHIALVRSSGTAKVYVNGVLAVTQATTPNTTTARVLNIGGVTNVLFVGYISNVHVVKGTAVYTAAFTPSTTPLTAITNTVLLTCQSNRFIDKSTNNFTITKNGDTTVSPAIPFTPNSSYASYGSAYFDGTGDYITAPTNTGYQFGSGDFTVEFWTYPTSMATFAVFTGVWAGTNSTSSWLVTVGATDTTALRFGYSDGTTATFVESTTGAVKLNNWTHVAVVRTSGVLKMFSNGVQVYSAALATTFASPATVLSFAEANLANYGQFYMSDIRIIKGTALYTTTFTPPTAPLTAVTNTQLLALQYNGGANNYGIIDNSNFNNIITRFGNTTQGSFSPYSQTGRSYYFNGSTDLINTATSTTYQIATNDYCLEGWAMFTGSFGTTAIFLSNFYQNASGDYGSYVGINASGYPYGYLQNGNAGGQTVALTGSTLITKGVWTHYALVRNGVNLSLFVDGVRVATSAVAGVVQPSHNVVTLGRYSSNYALNWWPGYISNARMCVGTTPYTATNTTLTVPTSPLAPTSGTVYLSAQSNRFIDNSALNATLTATGTPSIQAYSPFGGIREATPITYSNYFDGTGDYLSIPNNTAINLATGDFTIEAWVFNTVNTALGTIIEKDGVFGSSYYSYNLGLDSSGRVIFGVGGGNAATYVQNIGGTTTLALNTWYHIAGVRSGNTITLYINGVSNASATISGTIVDGGKVALIGYQTGQASGAYWNGYISNVRIVKGTAVYTSNFTPSTTLLTAISGTSLLTCQSTTIIDNSSNNFTLTAAGNVTPKQLNPFGYTAQTSVSYSPVNNGGSVYFDGTGDYITTTATTAMRTSDYTIECWIYHLAAPNPCWIWDGLFNSGPGPMIFVTTNGTNLSFYKDGVTRIINATIPAQLNQWVHYAFCRVGTTTTAYINGVSVGLGTDDTATTTTLRGGFGARARDGAEPNQAIFSDYRILLGTAAYKSNFIPPAAPNSPSTSTVLKLDFTNGGIVDAHGSNNLETVGNTQLAPLSPYASGGKSLYFDGTGDSLKIVDNPNINLGIGDFTLECWAYFNVVNAEMCLINKGWQSSSAYASYCIYMTSGGSLRFLASTSGGSWDIANEVVIGTMTASTWTHIAVTRSGTTYRAFINGVIVSGFTFTNSGSHANIAAQTLFIGGRTDNNSSLNGYLDDVRITKGFARYTTTFTPPTAPLIAK